MGQKLKLIGIMILFVGAGTAVVTQTDVVENIIGGNILDQVPSEVDFVGHIDMEIIEREGTRELVSTSLKEAPENGEYSDVDNMKDLLDKIEKEAGFNVRNVDAIALYGKSNAISGRNTGYLGAIVHAEFNSDALKNLLREQTDRELEEKSYGDKTVYISKGESSGFSQNPDLWIGVLNTGEYAIGTEQAVKDAIDVENGDSEAFKGEMRTALEDTRGDLRMVIDMPEDMIPDESATVGSGIDISYLNNVVYMAGGYYIESGEMGSELRMVTEGEEAAKNVKELADGVISLATTMVSDEEAKETLRSFEVERSGTTVEVSYSQSIESVKKSIKSASEIGSGGLYGSQLTGTQDRNTEYQDEELEENSAIRNETIR